MNTAAGAAPLLEVREVTKRFGGVTALRGASLRVGRGELVGLIGPNGCGKSTLLGMVSGHTSPDSGEIRMDGEVLSDRRAEARAKQLGVRLVPQELGFSATDLVWESVVLGAEPTRYGVVDRKEARRRATEALGLLEHELDLDAPMSSLTAVDRRLVLIARGLASSGSRLLILDEPTAGLPQDDSAKVLAAMRPLVGTDRSLIFVSHHIEDLVGSCDRVYLMRDGAVSSVLEGEEVQKAPIVTHLMAGVAQREEIRGRAPAVAGQADCVGEVDSVSTERLDGLSLRVHRGEVVGIAGILGSGAADVIRVLTGQLQPVRGDVAVGRNRLRPTSTHRAFQSGVGFVSGDRSSLVIKGMTVSEHVALPALNRLCRGPVVSGRKEREWVQQGLDRLDVVGERSQAMSQLSGGNQQRALMARWVSDKTVDLLVVDQPTVGVDLAGRAQLLEVLRDLAEERGILLLAEPDELAAVADRVLCIRRGRIVRELKGDEVVEDVIIDAIS